MELKQKKVTVNDKEYTLQSLPIREAFRIRDQWLSGDTASGVDQLKMAELCLEHIVVNPKVTLDDFNSISEAEELIAECIDFVYVGKH